MKRKQKFKWFFLPFLILAISMTYGQEVTGKIIDNSTNIPIVGATVSIKGTNQGEVSNFDGDYSITVSEFPVVLVFSYLGYETQEIKVESSQTLNVALVESATYLDRPDPCPAQLVRPLPGPRRPARRTGRRQQHGVPR